MLGSVLLAAALSLSASPAAYDSAQAHQSYQITITSNSDAPMTVHASLNPDANCSIQFARKPTWATLSGPATLTLAPHASQRYVVAVQQPPPGQSELVAAFVASDPSPSGKAGVSSSAGVGTALRFSEPGKTVVTPCPKPKSSGNPHIRTVYVGASKATPTNTFPLVLAIAVLGSLLVCGALALFILRLRKPRGAHR